MPIQQNQELVENREQEFKNMRAKRSQSRSGSRGSKNSNSNGNNHKRSKSRNSGSKSKTNARDVSPNIARGRNSR